MLLLSPNACKNPHYLLDSVFKLGMLQNQNKRKDEQLKGKMISWEIWV